MVKHGLEIIVVGYHQPADARAFADSLAVCHDQTPWRPTYFSVDAEGDDFAVGNSLWGPENHIVCAANVGHAAACNQSASWRTDFDTLFFCNADTRLFDGVIDRCFDTLWSDPSYGCVGPRQVDEQGRITAGGIFGTQAAPKHRGWHESGGGYEDLRDDAVTTSGALYMIKRHVWDELAACLIYTRAEEGLKGTTPRGAMPAVAHYYSETWPSYHMAAHGYKNVYEGRCTARHDWHKASPQGPGSWGERNLPTDRDHFRALCDRHGIPHD